MLTNSPIYPSLPAADLERAKRFYAEQLGLTPESELPGGLFYRCGKDSRFAVFTSQGQASGTHTQAMWLVEDVESEVTALKARGVVVRRVRFALAQDRQQYCDDRSKQRSLV
jgi:predicted enzyme related to lactoylglutathione lyase